RARTVIRAQTSHQPLRRFSRLPAAANLFALRRDSEVGELRQLRQLWRKAGVAGPGNCAGRPGGSGDAKVFRAQAVGLWGTVTARKFFRNSARETTPAAGAGRS